MKIGAEMNAAMVALDRQVAAAKNVAGQAIIKDRLEKPNAIDSLGDGKDKVGAAGAADENAMNEMAEGSEEEGAEGALGNNLDVTA